VSALPATVKRRPDGRAGDVDLPPGVARRVAIEHVRPAVGGGRFFVKRTIGEAVEVRARVFADGHDVLTVALLDRVLEGQRGRPAWPREADATAAWRETPMSEAAPGTDEWAAAFRVETAGWHEYAVIGWVDRFRTWQRKLAAKAAAGQDVELDLREGAQILRDLAAGAGERGADGRDLLAAADALHGAQPPADRVGRAVDPRLADLAARHADRSRATMSAPLPVWVDRERARFGAWYEVFPR
jgi:starch synthase (maltosyl-transferring)